MNPSKKPIQLPRFAVPTFNERVRCPSCGMAICQTDLLFVGAGRARDGDPCFAFQYRCPSCARSNTVLDITHRFTQPDWWAELSAWNDAAPTIEHMAADACLARRTLPKIGPMVIGPWPLQSVWIRGGYRGDVGPVIFHYESEGKDATIGFIRLERDCRFNFLDFEDQYCLPRLDLGRFAAVPDGGTFPLDGRDWIKMSRYEIEEIIRDRVFEPVVNGGNDPVTTPKPKRRSAHGSTNSKKGRKSSRRSSRNAGTLDSRRRRPKGLH